MSKEDRKKKVVKEEKLSFNAYFASLGKKITWKAGMKKYKGDCSDIKKVKFAWDEYFKYY